jgi:hypothetical protein
MEYGMECGNDIGSLDGADSVTHYAKQTKADQATEQQHV